jgi:DNA polymerase V
MSWSDVRAMVPWPPGHPLNLQALLAPRPHATVLVRVSGHSMHEAGIQSGDLLVVDRSLQARPGQIVVAQLADGFTLKRLVHTSAGLVLQPANPAFPVLAPPADSELRLWGVALHVIRRLLP